MSLLKINGTSIKTPQKYKVTESDIDGETTRNAKGEMIRDRLATKVKIECEFPPLKQSEISVILKSVSSTFFSVTYLDPKDGVQTKTMYVGDRSTPMYRYGNGTTEVLWEGLSMNFIEK